jgi:hypothetical protein
MNDRFIGTGTANESGEFCIPAMAVGVAATLGGYRSGQGRQRWRLPLHAAALGDGSGHQSRQMTSLSQFNGINSRCKSCRHS